MTIETNLYDTARKYLLDGTINILADTIKVALLNSTYSPQPAAAAWAAATVYAAGTIIKVSGRFYEAVIGGTSSGAQPIFPTIRGSTLTENTVTWLCWGYSPPSTHSIFADVSANEIGGTGYTAGGVTMTTKTVTQALRSATFSADPVLWTGAQFTAHYAAIYKLGTVGGIVNPLIAYLLLNSTNADVIIPVATKFSIAWPTTGFFTFY